jgi:alpha-ketoglutarate-dependent taurine dioxygenase
MTATNRPGRSTLALEPLSATVGAQVHDVDTDRLLHDEALPAAVLDALEQHGALVFRGLHIDDTQQIAFSKRLGRVETFGDGELAAIFRITLDPTRSSQAEYLKGTFAWHIDGLTEDIPIMATLLTAHAVAERGGETEFASTYAAYDDLTDDEKLRFEDVRVVHTFEAAQRAHKPDPTPEELARWRKRPSKIHPLVWTHASGRKSLVLGSTAAEVVGQSDADGRAFLDGLLDRSTRPSRVYRHTWSVGDLAIWDNCGVVHRACPYDPSSRRDMHRTTLYGNEAVQ